MRVAAVVAARGGSERVVSKNTRPFAGTTLLDIKLAQLSRLSGMDDVVLTSEDDAILAYAARYGCKVIRRPMRLASGAAVMSDVYEFIAMHIEADVVVYANCTNPLVRDETIEQLIVEYRDEGRDFDSLNTASPVREFLLENGVPLNYNPAQQPRSQDLPDIAALNFAVNVLDRDTMIARSNVLGATPRLRYLDEVQGIDIDTPTDFALAEFLYVSNGGEQYLRNKRNAA